jgi:hypothetical protein
VTLVEAKQEEVVLPVEMGLQMVGVTSVEGF